jgi:hypothetical protein
VHKFVPTITTILDYGIILNDDRTILLLVEVNTNALFQTLQSIETFDFSIIWIYHVPPPHSQ